MGICVGIEVLGRLAELATPDGFACYSGGGKEAGATKEEDGELAEGSGRGYGCTFVGDGVALGR